MKIKNMTLGNLSVGSMSSRGSAHKNYMTVPGEATLELNDDLWLNEFAEPAAHIIKAGNLKIVEAPAMTEEEIEEEAEKALAAAQALVEAAKGTKKLETIKPKT
jgi:nucleotide-binding universal stress UspA family protein